MPKVTLFQIEEIELCLGHPAVCTQGARGSMEGHKHRKQEVALTHVRQDRETRDLSEEGRHRSHMASRTEQICSSQVARGYRVVSL